MGEPARRLATYADVLAAPEGMVAEILAGELYLSPRPRNWHAAIEGGMHVDLADQFGRRRGGSGPGGWHILMEPELHLGRPDPTSTVAVPDLAGWRRERMPEIPDEAAFVMPPDWVCEILSSGARNIRRDRMLKPDLYASCGVPYLWLVDPDAQLLEIWHLQGDVYARIATFAGDVRARAKPFDAVELDLGGWWPPGAEP